MLFNSNVSSTANVPTIISEHLSSTLKTPHSPTPLPANLQDNIYNYTMPRKEKHNILDESVFKDSGVLTPTLQTYKNPSQPNAVPHEILRTHLTFKVNHPSLYIIVTKIQTRTSDFLT